MTEPARYRVRRAEIEALQWTGDNITEMEAFAGSAFSCYEGAAELLGNPGGAWHPLDEGNYAVKGVTGEFFIIFGEDFADNYEPIPPAADEWQAVLHNNFGSVIDIADFGNDQFDFSNDYIEISIVRRSALPTDGQMPGSYVTADLLINFDEFDFYKEDEGVDPASVRRRFVQAQAMAAGLNAAESHR